MAADVRRKRRLLLVAWEGADWDIVHPLLDAGRMPALRRLVETGAMGHLETLDPAIAPVAWTTLATGKRPDKHGVLGFTSPSTAQDRVVPFDARERKVPALWNMFAADDRRALVVGWPARPAEPVDGAFVTHLFAQALGSDDADVALPAGVVWPPDLTAEIAPLRVHPGEIGADELLPFVPAAGAIDQRRDRRLAALAVMLAATASIHAVATELMARKAWDFAAVHYDFLDRVSHVFMPYHPPRGADVDERDFEIYRHVVAAAYCFADMLLARLVELAGEDADVVLASDHGFQSGARRPRTLGRGRAMTRWHRRHGLLVLNGGSIRAEAVVWGANLLDVAPTTLALAELPVGQDMDGRVLAEALEAGHPIDTIPSWDPRASSAADWPAPDPDESDLERIRLVDQGYLTRRELDGAAGAERAARDLRYNLGQSLLSAGRLGEASDIFEDLHRQAPDDEAVTMALARCCQETGTLARCRRLIETLTGQVMSPARRSGLMGSLLYAEGDFDGALGELMSAEQSAPDDPDIHCRIGQVYLRLGNVDGALAAFDKAITLEGNHARAHHGLAMACLKQQRYADAEAHARRCVGLCYHYPPAHYHLGAALAMLGRPDEAAAALNVAVAQEPQLPEAHAWLARLYETELGRPKSAAHHRQMARIGEVAMSEVRHDIRLSSE